MECTSTERRVLIEYEGVLLSIVMNYSKIRHVSVARLPVVNAQRRRHNSESVCCERLALLPAKCGEYRIDGAIF
jgi:hypothetical protein